MRAPPARPNRGGCRGVSACTGAGASPGAARRLSDVAKAIKSPTSPLAFARAGQAGNGSGEVNERGLGRACQISNMVAATVGRAPSFAPVDVAPALLPVRFCPLLYCARSQQQPGFRGAARCRMGEHQAGSSLTAGMWALVPCARITRQAAFVRVTVALATRVNAVWPAHTVCPP